MLNVEVLGQVFTPTNIVTTMLQLRRNKGSVLEPSAGDGAFYYAIHGCIGIEIDQAIAPAGSLCMDFFSYPTTDKFDTIIGNPPYVAYKYIQSETKALLPSGYDKRTNLYVFFINKCLDHLNEHGEIIFITPRDFLQATHARPLNERLYTLGTITDLIDLGDQPIFKGYSPNTIIWRFEKDNFSRVTNGKRFECKNGQLLFLNNDYNVPFNDLFYVKVGAVSGLDEVFANESIGNIDFVYSKTALTGKTRKMISVSYNRFGEISQWHYLKTNYDRLIARKIRKFNKKNFYQWGRWHYESMADRVYVNCKTRNSMPFFTHECKNYEGSVLAIFPNIPINCHLVADRLNDVDWQELGFVCDGRYIFGQKRLENTMLPSNFNDLLKIL